MDQKSAPGSLELGDRFRPLQWLEMPLGLQQLHVTEILTAAVLIGIGLYYYAGIGVKKERLPYDRLPPGPRPWPILGNLGQLSRMLHQDLANLAKVHGPIMLLRLGSVPTVVITSPQLAKEVLKTHDQVFASRPSSTQGKIVGYDSQTIGFSPYGSYWRHVRKVFILELFTAKRMQQFQRVREQEVLSTLQSILQDCKGGEGVCLADKFGDLTKNNVTRMMINKSFFGQHLSASDMTERGAYVDTFKELANLMGAMVPGDYIPLIRKFDIKGSNLKRKMRRVRRKMDDILDRIINEHREKFPSYGQDLAGKSDLSDIVDVLLSRPGKIDEKPLTDNQIKAILQSVMLGGTETSSSSLEWTMAEVLRQPLILKKLQDELDAVVGRERLVEESDIPQLHYLQAVVKESFRLHPVVPLMGPHQSMEACEVGGYYVPAKTRVLVNCWALGRDPAAWERSLEFYPERFLNSTKDVNGQDFDLLPFGSGRRSCPGRPLGLVMVQYTLAVLLHACAWTLPHGLTPEDVDLRETLGITLPMATKLQAVATARLPLHILRLGLEVEAS